MKFTVKNKQLVYQVWTTEVEADSAEEALNKILTKQVPETIQSTFENTYTDEYEWEVLDEEGDILLEQEGDVIEYNSLPVKLIKGDLYTIYDPGLKVWLKDYKYIGLNGSQTDVHLFGSTDGPGPGYDHKFGIFNEDIPTMVKYND